MKIFNWICAILFILLLLMAASCTTEKNVSKGTITVDSSALREKSDSIRMLKTEIDQLSQTIHELQYTQVQFDTVFIAGDTIVNTVTVREDGTIEATGKIKSLTISKEKLTQIISAQKKIIDSLSLVKQKEKIEYKTVTEWKDREVKRSFIPWWIWLVVAGSLIYGFRKQLSNLKFTSMKKIILFALCAIFLMSCGGSGVQPTDNITWGQAFSHVSASASYWVWLVISAIPLTVYLVQYFRGKVDELKGFMMFICIGLILFAFFMRPCEVAANTTVEQAVRGGWIGY